MAADSPPDERWLKKDSITYKGFLSRLRSLMPDEWGLGEPREETEMLTARAVLGLARANTPLEERNDNVDPADDISLRAEAGQFLNRLSPRARVLIQELAKTETLFDDFCASVDSYHRFQIGAEKEAEWKRVIMLAYELFIGTLRTLKKKEHLEKRVADYIDQRIAIAEDEIQEMKTLSNAEVDK